MSKEVLYISYDGMTDPLGRSQVLPYLKGIAKDGFTIHLISFEKESVFKSAEATVRMDIKDLPIHWHPLTYHKSPPVLSTVYDILQMYREAKKICKERPIGIVHCRSYISSLIAGTLKKRFGTRFIFDMRGFWADERVEGGIWNLSNPVFKTIYRFFKKKERAFILNADWIVSLTHKGKEIIESEHPSASNKISVIPTCVDLQHFNSENIDKAFVEDLKGIYGLKGKRILSYVGSLGTWYMTNEMLKFFAFSKQANVFDLFMVITKDDPSGLYRQAKETGVDPASVLVLPGERNQLPSMLSLADWSVFFIRPSFSKSASSPTKFAELLAMNTGIITNTGVGDNERLFKKYNAGVLLNGFETEDFQKALTKIKSYNHSENRKTAEDYFSLEKGVAEYLRIYRSLL